MTVVIGAILGGVIGIVLTNGELAGGVIGAAVGGFLFWVGDYKERESWD